MQAKNYEQNGLCWLSKADAAKHAGNSSPRLIEIWEQKGYIKVARIITDGHVKGKVLVCKASLDAFIESFVGVPPHDAAINKNREGAKS